MKFVRAVAVFAVLATTACAGTNTPRETSGERIVTLTAGITEAVFALGAGDLVVARDISSTIDEAADLPIVTTAHDINVEALLAVRPTLVLIDEDSGPQTALDQIESTGVRIELVENATKVDDIVPRLERVASILGLEDRATRLSEAINSDLTRLEKDPALADVRVAFLYLRGPAGVYLIGGPGSGPDSIITATGAIDAGTSIGLDLAFTPLTPEAMVEAAPDVLLVTTTGLTSVNGVDGLVELAGVAQTPAGKAKRVITVEDGLLFSFGPRTPSLIESLRQEIAAEMEKAVP